MRCCINSTKAILQNYIVIYVCRAIKKSNLKEKTKALLWRERERKDRFDTKVKVKQGQV